MISRMEETTRRLRGGYSADHGEDAAVDVCVGNHDEEASYLDPHDESLIAHWKELADSIQLYDGFDGSVIFLHCSLSCRARYWTC